MTIPFADLRGSDVPHVKPDIPGYRILRQLGHGGMSEIWLAEQVALARPVAIKVVSLGEEADARLARFRQEASLIARFDHPNVVGIIEFGETGDGRLYFSMPYVPNGTLAQATLNGDVPRVREVLAQVLDALAYIHQHGVVHRDVKPENVLFDNVGRARLADFGVSRSMAGVSRHTRAGETFGSSLYMSPEQARGETLDGRSDLYSLGAVAYELLTGNPPFRGPDDLSIAVAHLHNPVPRLPEGLRHWQGWFDTAMAKRRERRFPDANAMRSAMQRLAEATPGNRWRARWAKPMTTGVLSAAIALLAVAAVWRIAGGSGDRPVPVPVPETSVPATSLPSSTGDPPVGPLDDAGGRFDATPESPDRSMSPMTPAARGDAISQRSMDGRVEADDGAVPTAPVPEPPVAREQVAPAPAVDAPTAVAPGRTVASAPARGPVDASPGPGGAAVANPDQPAPVVSGGFQSVPAVPLFLLAGSPDEQLRRIDGYLDAGRRMIDADRVRVEQLRRETSDRDERRQLRDDFDARKANYESWRRQVLELRKKVQRRE